MAGFLFLYLIAMLPLAIVMKIAGEKPKVFLIIAGMTFVPALVVFGIIFPHVLLRGWM